MLTIISNCGVACIGDVNREWGEEAKKLGKMRRKCPFLIFPLSLRWI